MYKNVHFNLFKHKIPCWVLSCSQASFYSCFLYIYYLAKKIFSNDYTCTGKREGQQQYLYE